MKKQGFTIAEILITMGIIGIVASLTIPPLASSYQKQSYASSLSVAVADFENAVSTLMMQEDATSIFDLEAWRLGGLTGGAEGSDDDCQAFVGNIRTLNITNFNSDANSIYVEPVKAFNGDELENGGLLSNKVALFTKKGIIYSINVPTRNEAINDDYNEYDAYAEGINLFMRAAEIVIDVNGVKKPNRFGRDLFAFILSEDGKLYPYGSKDVECLLSEGASVSDWRDDDADYACNDDVVNSNGVGCTARLIENGYRMDY